MESKSNSGFVFGLDIGIASVGWAVLAPDHIVALGVRAFNRAEVPKTGESLNLTRRNARLMRHRLHRRATRLARLATVLKERGLITDVASFHRQPPLQSPWHLRVAGLDRRLTPEEWARVLYHLAKHRGFHWSGLGDEGADAKETGRIKEALDRSGQVMQSKGYRTAAEMILGEFPDAQRNKQGDYQKALSRRVLAEELSLLFERQRALGNPHAGPDMEQEMLGENNDTGYFWEQRPPLSGEDLLKMLGRCTLEKSEFRAPKHSFSAERHMWLTRLNTLRIFVDGKQRPLNTEERSAVIRLPYENVSVTYTSIRNKLQKAELADAEFWFAGLADRGGKNPEATVLCKLTAWHEIKKRLHEEGLQKEWEAISAPALERGQSDILDTLAETLSIYKEEPEIARRLGDLALPNPESTVPALAKMRFNQFSNLSLFALRKILKHMEHGQRYDEACKNAGYDHAQTRPRQKARYLPSFYSGRTPNGSMIRNPDISDIPRNPVVLRSLKQAQKVVNALVKRYGTPESVRIEMARDLSNPLDERRKIEAAQRAYQDENERRRQEFSELFKRLPKKQELTKLLLYREQHGKCIYSLQPIDLDRLLEPKYVEVDHILPYSRSQDNSRNNQVLTLSRENQNKGNKTPYEYLDGASESVQWQNFEGFVRSTIRSKAKKSRLLRKNFGVDESQEFRARHLNDTRYICRFFKNLLEQRLLLATESEQTRCVVLSGSMTGFLRARWGLHKDRGENDRHHALDAAVVAACDHSLVKRVSDYYKRKELSMVPEDFVDPETGEVLIREQPGGELFPVPWNAFRDEVRLRVTENDKSALQDRLRLFGTYSEEEIRKIKPLFVSRAVQRRGGGAVHEETIYSLRSGGRAVKRVTLSSLRPKDFDKDNRLVGLVDRNRNEKLYAAIEARLRKHGGDGAKAFPIENPMRKPDRLGNPTGPIVRCVKMEVPKLSGVRVRKEFPKKANMAQGEYHFRDRSERMGIAKNATMIRVDFFEKSGRFFLVPVYMNHRGRKKNTGGNPLPDRAIVAHKDESDWTLISHDDRSFRFLFSVYPNDYLRITLKDRTHEGYFAKCNRSTGAIDLWVHDREKTNTSDGKVCSIGVKTALSVTKHHVDVLGNIYAASTEVRRELA